MISIVNMKKHRRELAGTYALGIREKPLILDYVQPMNFRRLSTKFVYSEIMILIELPYWDVEVAQRYRDDQIDWLCCF